jgi:CRP-like cAMP-binding protein
VNEASYDAGAWLFAQGDLSDKLYLILEGAVRLTRVDRDGVPAS